MSNEITYEQLLAQRDALTALLEEVMAAMCSEQYEPTYDEWPLGAKIKAAIAAAKTSKEGV